MKKFLSRLTEPSTWAGIAAPLFAFGILDQQQAQVVVEAGSTIAWAASGTPWLNLGVIGGSISALVAALLPEKNDKK